MKAVYVDLHIHTSEDPEKLNTNYNCDLLINKIKEKSNNNEILISITDHNTINKKVYLELAKREDINMLIGSELHIKMSDNKPAYHCHIYFDNEKINEETIDDLNIILDKLYPCKRVEKTDNSLPKIDRIIDDFSKYEFILIPHGGQSHATFNTAVSSDDTCDGTIERTIYYNQIEGFSARSNKNLEDTIEYLEKLGISEFVNLLTGSDNYNPQIYPNPKDKDASEFIPTWIYSEPTFQGLRISLSESSRLEYNDKPTYKFKNAIGKVNLENDKIKIDVELTPGLNVVIGESSSGKSLFIDSIHRKLIDDFSESPYNEFNVTNIQVENLLGTDAHYINQNFISQIISTKAIQEMPIVKKLFPNQQYKAAEIDKNLQRLKKQIDKMIESVQIIEIKTDEIRKIPNILNLIINCNIPLNIIGILEPKIEIVEKLGYEELTYSNDLEFLTNLEERINSNLLSINISDEVNKLKENISELYLKNQFENKIREILSSNKIEMFEKVTNIDTENKDIILVIEKLKISIKDYIKALNDFDKAKKEILNYEYDVDTVENEFGGNKLSISNKLKVTKEMFLEVINNLLKKTKSISNIEDVTPKELYIDKFLKSNNINNYDDLKIKIFSKITAQNIKEYKIKSSNNMDFDKVSPGWKTAIIIDIILKYKSDIAPLIIDQPEDNLANNYINNELIKQLKGAKESRQIIIVSHNATIPMLGDAQNIVFCSNNNGKLEIVSRRLESKLNGKNVIDYIAEITDGGKKSIKKRFKKYNFKKYKEE